MEKITIYALVCDLGDEKNIRFYVGQHRAGSSREQDHFRNAFNPNNNEYDTNKYRFMRELKESGIQARIEILTEDATDDDDEYAWVLKIADENRERGFEFYGNPLTNMKAGDFLSEILADRNIRTPQQIKQYREHQKFQQHVAKYDRQRDCDQFGDQTNSAFGKLFVPERLEEMKVKTAIKKTRTTNNYNEVERRRILEEETRRLIERDRSEGRSLPGGISDE